MKKTFLFFVLITVCSVFVGCSSDDEDFNYDVELLVGKWQIKEIEMDGRYVDVTKPPYYPEFPLTYATFNTDGSYYGSGIFGTGSGTYKAQGNTIICYVDGTEYARYHILNLSGTQCELKMSRNNESVNIRCVKQ